MDDESLLLLLAEIRHQSISTAIDAEILRRELGGRPMTEEDAVRIRRLAAVSHRYRAELDIAWRHHYERTLRGAIKAALLRWLVR
jgi:hypothetical protein